MKIGVPTSAQERSADVPLVRMSILPLRVVTNRRPAPSLRAKSCGVPRRRNRGSLTVTLPEKWPPRDKRRDKENTTTAGQAEYNAFHLSDHIKLKRWPCVRVYRRYTIAKGCRITADCATTNKPLTKARVAAGNNLHSAVSINQPDSRRRQQSRFSSGRENRC